jgi:hypothetical protein
MCYVGYDSYVLIFQNVLGGITRRSGIKEVQKYVWVMLAESPGNPAAALLFQENYTEYLLPFL